MPTIKFLLGVICLAFTGGYSLFKCNLLVTPKAVNKQNNQRAALVQTAENEVGVREKTGNNDGVMVEAYLAFVGLKKPEPWCAAFVCWVYAKNGFKKPRSGWSPDLFPSSRLARLALPGNILGIYFPDKNRIAHVGIIIREKDDWIYSVEGNTDVAGSREGDGVYRRMRHKRTIYKIADWVAERGKAK